MVAWVRKQGCCDLLGESVFRCPLCLFFGRGDTLGFVLVYMSVSCSLLPACIYPSVCDKVTGSGCVWRWRTSPQGVVSLVFHAHGQRRPLWDLRREREEEESKKDERGQRAQGQGWAGVHQNSIVKHALQGSAVLRGGYVCVCVCARVCVSLACI